MDVSDQHENEYEYIDHLDSSLKGSNSDLPPKNCSDNNQFGNRPSHSSLKENKSPRNHREDVESPRKKVGIFILHLNPFALGKRQYRPGDVFFFYFLPILITLRGW